MQECLSFGLGCVSVFNLPMRVCSSTNLSVLLEKSPFNITHSRSEIEWSGLLKCLATGSIYIYIYKSNTARIF